MPPVKVKMPPFTAEETRGVVRVLMPHHASDTNPNEALVKSEHFPSVLIPIDDDLKKKMNGRQEAWFEGERFWSWKIGKEVPAQKVKHG